MKKKRMQQILDKLQEKHFLSTLETEKIFNASAATVRRDFNELAASGLAIRTHGGIQVLDEEKTPSVPYGLRENWNSEEKCALAREAVKYIQSEHSVMLYGGSTTGYLGLYLSKGRIVTNLPDLCSHLRVRFPTGNGPQITLTGGQLNFRTGLLVGPAFRRSLENYECDIGICSAYGFDETGLTDIDDECAEQISIMLEKSKLRIVLADHTKFKRKSFCRCLPWEKINILITTFDPQNHEIIKSAREKGVKIIFVEKPTY